MLAHYRALIRLRHDLAVIADGDLTTLFADDPQIWAYTRATAAHRLLVIANCGRDTRTVDIGAEWNGAQLLLGNLPGAPAASAVLELRGWDARIYSIA